MKEFTREQIAQRAIEIADLIITGNYKNAIAGIGRMVALAKIIKDGYWKEKLNTGKAMEKYYLESGMTPNHPDRSRLIT